MADIRKSFSFREGLQVDNEVLVVGGALVGIGTTLPTEKLEVKGNFKVSGLSTLSALAVSGVSTFNSDVRIGSGIRIQNSTGVITATAFYGNGATLSNLPTSQWIDVDVGLGFTSIYAQGNVGVGTINPLSTFQVGGNPNLFQNGVGINSNGDIRVSGVVTSRSFVGFGSEITAIRGENITLGTISNSVFPIINNDRLPSNINVTGVITAQSGFVGNVIGIASTARTLTGTPNITVGVVTSTLINSTDIIVTNLLTSPRLVSGLSSVGILTVSQILQVGSGSTELNFTGGRLGIGTNAPTTDVQIIKNTNTTLEVLSRTGESRISIGQSVGIGNSTGIVRYGNSKDTFEFLNRGIGGLNYYVHSGSQAGVNTGSFNWIYGQTNNILLTLTYNGRLGLGITNPTNNFHVVGTSTVTGNSFVGGDFSVVGPITFGSGAARATLGSPTQSAVLLNTNLNASTGITTIQKLLIPGNGSIGIGTTNPKSSIDVLSGSLLAGQTGVNTTSLLPNIEFSVYGQSVFTGTIAVGSTSISAVGDEPGIVQIYDDVLKLYNSNILLSGVTAIGFNTDSPLGVIDMSNSVGEGGERVGFLPPIVTTTERNNMSAPVEGWIIYNSSTKKLNFYNGTAWREVDEATGGGP